MSHNLKRLLIAVYICLVCLLAIATFLEQACGTDFVEKYIYHTFWFCCLWGILAALAVMALIRRQLWKHLPTLLLHGSFLVILAGAMLTFVGSRKGYVHLTVGNKVGDAVHGNAAAARGTVRILPRPQDTNMADIIRRSFRTGIVFHPKAVQE